MGSRPGDRRLRESQTELATQRDFSIPMRSSHSPQAPDRRLWSAKVDCWRRQFPNEILTPMIPFVIYLYRLSPITSYAMCSFNPNNLFPAACSVSKSLHCSEKKHSMSVSLVGELYIDRKLRTKANLMNDSPIARCSAL